MKRLLSVFALAFLLTSIAVIPANADGFVFYLSY
jgi:hypothetical protein